MKRMIGLFAVNILLTCVAGTMDVPAETTINDSEAALGEAMFHKDLTTLDRLVGGDWTIQSDSGTMGTKAGFLDDVRSGALIIKSFRLHDVHVRVLGDVAFVQGFDDEVSSYKGKDNSGTYNWLDVWQRRDGRWVSVASQLTRVEARK
ncbi:nuclear transport factor 2 family protein [Tunturibacter psychrotolerans]|uniref:Nuclear transport factor 2 family protein n=1 Tax=Tunturiibacter psychrotolerans TaxID=3069686 RepID=A0AAU7ZU08_9BACT